MSLHHIKCTIHKSIGINANAFEIQIRDDRSNDYYTLDDELLEDVLERMPRTSTSALYGEIVWHSFSGYYDLNRYDQECKSTGYVSSLLAEGNVIDNESNIPEEVSLICHEENEPECFQALLFPTTDEGTIPIKIRYHTKSVVVTFKIEKTGDLCSSYEFDCVTNSFQPHTNVNQTNSLTSNDEITRHICHPDMSFQTDENTDYEVQSVVQAVLDFVVKQSVSIDANSVKSLCSDWYESRSDEFSLHLSDQIIQGIPLMELSSSLQFVHDVHRYQKTQHDTNNADECVEKNLSPYVMRIQGIKTDADKGKSILPRIKLPSQYISLSKQAAHSLHLMIGIVREEQVNDKRLFYVCDDIQLLSSNTKKTTEAENPTQINLNLLSIQSNEIFELPLLLVNNSSRSTINQSKNRLLHELNESIAKSLHFTTYDPRFFRLLCTLVIDKTVAWNTLCLSDYIRPKQQLLT